jgi:hypothetical protein
MTSDADKIKKLKALIADPAATDGERAAAREKIATISHPARGMSDAELAATIARLKDERCRDPYPARRRASQKGEAGGDRTPREGAQQALQEEAQDHE